MKILKLIIILFIVFQLVLSLYIDQEVITTDELIINNISEKDVDILLIEQSQDECNEPPIFDDDDPYTIPSECLKSMLIGAGVASIVLVGITIILPCVGFGAIGPTAGSFAAWVQSLIGVVESGSLFALFQSIAMAGFSLKAIVIVTGGSAALAYAICKELGFENNGC